MFVDKAEIHLKAGKGGNGMVAFRREIYVPSGGPAGGDGGRGGSIIFEVDEGMRTLMDFRYKKQYTAPNGEDGKSKNMNGKDGEDLILRVPPGTVIREAKTGKLIADLVKPGDRKVVAQGGRGGKGNTHFKTATRQAPRFALAGEHGDELSVILELKMIADVGLVGFPNVGKSTILSIVTSANPKIANYHFTTLKPNLGVVKTKYGDSFVLADIPGLIEGAHEGVGLGHEFLRHVDRTKLLIHVIDVSGIEGRNPIDDFYKINDELKLYSTKLIEKPQVVAANKVDILQSTEHLKALEEELKKLDIRVFPISAATNKGIDELFTYVATMLKEIEENYEEEIEEEIYEYEREDRYHFIVTREEDVFIVEGKFLNRLLYSTNFDSMESLTFFQRELRKRGVIDKLKEMGMKNGDLVKIEDIEFEYQDYEMEYYD
ncbi:MAG: GTPase ObgE [Clostridiales bacterium]|nr:GTPase ObgE [Clostridiales bacterium]